jgi:hypothetical protein
LTPGGFKLWVKRSGLNSCTQPPRHGAAEDERAGGLPEAQLVAHEYRRVHVRLQLPLVHERAVRGPRGVALHASFESKH